MSGAPETPSAASCPICEGPNRCALAQGDGKRETCWCVNERFAPKLLERAGSRERCICRGCLEAAGTTESTRR